MSNNTSRSIAIYIETGNAERAYDKLISKEKELKEELEKATNPKQAEKLQKELDGLKEPIDRSAKKLKGELSPSFKDLDKTVTSLRNQLKNMSTGDANYDKVIKQYREANDLLQQQKKELLSLEKEKKNLGNQGGIFSGSFFGNLAANTLSNVVGFIKSAATESLQWAIQAEGVEAAYNNLNRPDLLKELQAATHGTVSELELMKKAVQANNFQIPLEQLGTLMEFAQRRARQTGESVDYLVDSIIMGISRKSIPIMDNLGISASALNKEVKKTGDFAKAAFNIVNSELVKAGPYAETAADKIDRIKTTLRDAGTSAGKFFLKLLEGKETANQLFDETAKSTKNFQDNLDKLLGRYDELKTKTNLNKKEQAELQGIINKIVEIVPQAVTEFDKYGNALDINKEKVKSFLKEQDNFLKIREKSAIDEQISEAERLAKRIERLARELRSGKKVVNDDGVIREENLSAKDIGIMQTAIANMQEKLIGTADLLKQKYKTEVPDAIQKTLDAAMLAKYGAKQVNDLLNPPKKTGPTEEEIKAAEEAARKAEQAAKEAESKRKQEYKKIIEERKRLAEELKKISVSLMPDEIGKEMAALNDRYLRLRQLAHNDKALLLQAEETYQKERQTLVDKYIQKTIANSKQQAADELKQVEERIQRIKELTTVHLPESVISLGNSLDADKLAEDELNVIKSRGKDRLEYQIKQLHDERDQELKNTNLTQQQKALIIEQYRQKEEELEAEHWVNMANQIIDWAGQMLSVFDTLAQAKTDRENAELERDRKNNDRKKDNLERRLKSGLLTQLEFDRQSAEIEKKQEAREKEIQLRQFRRTQRMQIAQAIMGGASAVVSTLAAKPGALDILSLGVFRAINIGLAVAATAAQIGKIASQKPPSMARGGKLHGPSHAEGGIPAVNKSGVQIAEVEGGEGITNKHTMADTNRYELSGTPSQIISRLNALHGGVHWESGATLRPLWSVQAPPAMNFSAINSSISTVRRFAAGGVMEDKQVSATQAPPQQDNSALQQTLMYLVNAVEKLESKLDQPIKAYTVITEQEAQQKRIDNIRNDAAWK